MILPPEYTFFANFIVAVFGGLLGSFANVVILRLPAKKSVVFPSSRCPKCETKIQWYDNIPVISWILLRGRCRQCQSSISLRYPLVELIMAFLFWCTFRVDGWSWDLVEHFILVFGLVVISFIDLDHFIIPDKFTLPGIVIGLAGSFLSTTRTPWDSFGGILLGGGFLWIIAYLYWTVRQVEGLGGGDIKLLAWIGAVLGWRCIPFVILGSSLLGVFYALIASLFGQGGLKKIIPYGPFISLATLIYLLAGGKALVAWYLEWHGL